LMWICVHLLRPHTVMCYLFILLGVVAAFHTGSQSVQLVALAGTLTFLIHYMTGKSFPTVVISLLVVFYIIMFFAGPLRYAILGEGEDSLATALDVDDRLQIWSAALQGIQQHPWTGLGFHTSHVVTDPEQIARLGPWAEFAWTNPHNLSLALPYEMGLSGFELGLVLLVSLGHALRGTDPRAAMIWAIMIAAVMTHMEVVRYPWISWWQFALLVAVMSGMLAMKRKALRL
jgi:O-antigen ligase